MTSKFLKKNEISLFALICVSVIAKWRITQLSNLPLWFLDVIYWSRQIIGLVLGYIWGLVPFHGFVGIFLFGALTEGIVCVWFTAVQEIDELESGGAWELILRKDLDISRAAGFFVT